MTDKKRLADPQEAPSMIPGRLLRQKADDIARRNPPPSAEIPAPLSPEAGRQLLHELQVHQIELEMQNDELRRIQAELEISRARYFDLYDQAPVGYFTLNEQGQILEANLTAAEMLGVTRNVLIHQPLSRFVHPDDQDPYYLSRRRLLATGVAQTAELRLARRDATHFWGRLEANLAPVDDGACVSRIVVIDNTEAKLAGQALREADRRKDMFLAMLAHELRNPLAPIRNAAQIIRLTGEGEPKTGLACDIIDRQVGHLAKLVDDLLDISRITHGKVTLQKSRIPLDAVLAQAMEAALPLMESRRHCFKIEFPSPPVHLTGDSTRLVQVLSNLLHNAAKYTPEGGDIALWTEPEGGRVAIRIKDSGMGITSELLPHIFDTFIQGDQALDRGKGGLGLGLALARHLIELHDGHIKAVSAGPGRGSEFIVELPLFEAFEALPVTPAADPMGSTPRFPGLRVLVVDDYPSMAESLALVLKLEGCAVETADDGPAALAAAQSFDPEVVLLDIGLPGMDGYEVARRLRADPAKQGVLLVAITGYGRAQDRGHADTAGFDHYLGKPLVIGDLHALMARFCAKQGIQAG